MSFDLILTNDPDHGLTRDYIPIFRELTNLGIKCTTAVFSTMSGFEEYPSSPKTLAKHCYPGETNSLDDPEYRDLMLEIRDLGHEVGYHGYSQISNTREEFCRGLEIYKEVFKEYPFTYMEHGGNPFKGHPYEMCKRETLDMSGADPNSEHYVLDIIRERFGCTWAHHDLLDDKPYFVPLEETFYIKDNVQMFRRHRMHYLEDVISSESPAAPHPTGDRLFVGYTHFGYVGYAPLKHGTLEYWVGPGLSRAINKLEQIVIDHSPTSYTIKEYIEDKL